MAKEKTIEIDDKALHRIIDHYVESDAKIKIGGKKLILGRKSEESGKVSEPIIIETPAIIINEISKDDIIALGTVLANFTNISIDPEEMASKFEEVKQKIKENKK